MKIYTAVELADVIEKHRAWLNDEEGGDCADLRDANLRYADLSGANLSGANLSGDNLRGADLSGANLSGANLLGANLRYANLRDANLRDADLRGANLRYANLRDANLRDADLRDANLRYANLRDANLREMSSMLGATGNMAEVKSVQCDLWPVTYTANHMQIGCQIHTIEEWWKFSGSDIAEMDRRAESWWAIWKPILKNIIEVSPAVAVKVGAEQ